MFGEPRYTALSSLSFSIMFNSDAQTSVTDKRTELTFSNGSNSHLCFGLSIFGISLVNIKLMVAAF